MAIEIPEKLSWISQDIWFLAKEIPSIRTKKNKDLVIGVSGDEGEGKSTLANQLCMAIGHVTGLGFDFEKNVLYSPKKEEIEKKMKELPYGSALNADEAIKIVYKHQWMKQTYLNILFGVARDEKKIVLLCMPRFRDFSEYFRNHRIKIWIHILSEGVAIVFRKDWSPVAKDPWWFDESQKIIDKARQRKNLVEFDNEDKIRVLERTRIYAGIVRFGPMSKDLESEYDVHKQKYKYEGLDKPEAKGKLAERYEKRLYTCYKIFKEMGLTEREIAEKVGVSQPSISGILNKKQILGIDD